MRPPGKQRLAQRYELPTTPIQWKVARRGRSSRLVRVEAALVELSVMGAAIVAPAKQVAPVGAQVEVFWEGISGWVVVRRSDAYRGSAAFTIHGVEFCDGRSPLGPTMFERLVVEPGEAARAAAAARPAIWAQPGGGAVSS
jgi:hypothetical protein